MEAKSHLHYQDEIGLHQRSLMSFHPHPPRHHWLAHCLMREDLTLPPVHMCVYKKEVDLLELTH